MMAKIHLGGFVAEKVIFGEGASPDGSGPDLRNALARALSLGNDLPFAANRAAADHLIRGAAQGTLDIFEISALHRAYARAGAWYYEVAGTMASTEGRAKIIALARALLERRTLHHGDLVTVLGPRPFPKTQTGSP